MNNNKPDRLSRKTAAAIRAAVHTANDPDDQAARAAGKDHRAITMRNDAGDVTSYYSCLCDANTDHDA